MYDIPNSSYSTKGITENYSVSYRDVMLEPILGTSTWLPETSENIWSLLWLSQNVLSVKLENIRIGTSLSILVTQNSKT